MQHDNTVYLHARLCLMLALFKLRVAGNIVIWRRKLLQYQLKLILKKETNMKRKKKPGEKKRKGKKQIQHYFYMNPQMIRIWISKRNVFPFKLYHNNNKRTIGNIAHLRKVPTNKHICTKLWLYHNNDQERNTLFIRIQMAFIYKKILRPLHSRMLCSN